MSQLVLTILIIIASISLGHPFHGRRPRPERYWGPYFGRVIDVDKMQGIPGVLVVAYWDQTQENFIQPEYHLIHVHETYTDENGYYAVPEYPPAWQRWYLVVNEPQLIYFKSGYGNARGYEIINNPGIENTKRWAEWNFEDAQRTWDRNHGKAEVVRMKQLNAVKERQDLLIYSTPIPCEPKCSTLVKLYHAEELFLAAEGRIE